ncbi:GAF and ANTAR domain-containing protein [Pseudarthrobacter sp. NCCP-2145]|uniref:GAF and ANTAR domain-containing protein n=1 Tax=Pseudarthrobacter sp. NCCP-2145 TaxID=2942290 RepID=UPI00203CCA63|nr:GAF and ANTAR domain-containing protein [Pseudarthrobacter sp. NCCP-2145]GKV74464.1 ANTAR domain-containing protein [Pseudarthrobacter sp. NCCP-2145]
MGSGGEDDFGRLYDLVAEMEDIRDLLGGITAIAAAAVTRSVGSQVECAVTLHRRKRPATIAGSDDEAMLLDGQEQELGDGPCTEALQTGEPEVLEGSSETRWPAFRRELAATSFNSVLGVPLDLGTDASAALNFFSTDTGVFTEEVAKDVQQFTQVAAQALRLGLRIAGAELKAEDLAAAMNYRTAIDMARGIIMAQNRCSGDEAFTILRDASSARNEKLHDVARAVVSGLAGSDAVTYFEP